MRVLRTTATFYPHVTGPAYQAYKMSEGLENRNHKSPIVTTNTIPEDEEPGFPPRIDGNEEFPFRVIRRKPLFSIDQYRIAPQTIYDYFSEPFDILHSHGYHNAIKDMFYLGNLIGSKPFVIHGHGSFSKNNDPTIERSWQFKLYNKLWYRTIRHADAIVVSSEQEREDAISFGVSDEKIYVIPVGKDPDVYTAVPRETPEDTFRILFVGRLAPRRNVELLIDAVADLERTDIELRIVGGEATLSNSSRQNYTSKLSKKIVGHNIEHQVVFTGPKYGDDLIREYRTADVFVNPTHYENFGQANLEAAFAGLPLIATPTGVALDLISEGETGYLFETKSKLINLLEGCVRGSINIDEMRTTISSVANHNYTWDTIIDDYLSMYDSITQ